MNTANNYHKNFDFSFKLKEAVRHSPHHNAKKCISSFAFSCEKVK